MILKLLRTGGFIPVTKSAEIETNISAEELKTLLSIIRYDPSLKKIKDGTYYQLVTGEESVSINMDLIPEQYKALFDKLKENLKII